MQVYSVAVFEADDSYFFIDVCYIPLKVVLAKYASTPVQLKGILFKILKGNNPNLQLWTLYALFFIALIVCVLANKKSNEILMMAIFGILQILSVKFPLGIVKNIFFELPFSMQEYCAKSTIGSQRSSIKVLE